MSFLMARVIDGTCGAEAGRVTAWLDRSRSVSSGRGETASAAD